MGEILESVLKPVMLSAFKISAKPLVGRVSVEGYFVSRKKSVRRNIIGYLDALDRCLAELEKLKEDCEKEGIKMNYSVQIKFKTVKEERIAHKMECKVKAELSYKGRKEEAETTTSTIGGILEFVRKLKFRNLPKVILGRERFLAGSEISFARKGKVEVYELLGYSQIGRKLYSIGIENVMKYLKIAEDVLTLDGIASSVEDFETAYKMYENAGKLKDRVLSGLVVAFLHGNLREEDFVKFLEKARKLILDFAIFHEFYEKIEKSEKLRDVCE